jgi:dsDNA-specific endonuclease/ATPase MutS2
MRLPDGVGATRYAPRLAGLDRPCVGTNARATGASCTGVFEDGHRLSVPGRHTPRTALMGARAPTRGTPDNTAVAARFTPGDAVQTPFGKGVVREVRNSGRLLVDVDGRALVVKESDVSALEVRRRDSSSAGRSQRQGRDSPHASSPSPGVTTREVDLHGLTVEEALARAERALDEAILADVEEVRFIHGRSGGRIRAALQKRLREISSVRHSRIDPRNKGVTIVEL